MHVYIQQPWENRRPGLNAWFGTELNRNNTWFEESRSWIDYLRRCCFLLQQGNRVADVAYFIGEDTPKMTGVRKPELPAGHDFDYINAEVILERMSVVDNRLVLPHGTNYRILVLPELETMRPELLKKIGRLVQAGATIIGRPPKRSPSLENYPHCDADVRQMAESIWGGQASSPSGERRLGKGRVIWGQDLAVVFEQLGVTTDFQSEAPLRYTHRSAGGQQIYFVANPKPVKVATRATFRVGNRTPELWWPDTGKIERPAVYQRQGDTLSLPIVLGPLRSVFVVFGDRPAAVERIVSVVRGNKTILDATRAPNRSDPSDAASAARVANDLVITMKEDGKVVGDFWQAGIYAFTNAKGQELAIDVTDVPAPITVTGPCQVTFHNPDHTSKKTIFSALTDWTKHADNEIRYFSGKATYRTRFTLPERWVGRQCRLDLGDVHSLVTSTAWRPYD